MKSVIRGWLFFVVIAGWSLVSSASPNDVVACEDLVRAYQSGSQAVAGVYAVDLRDGRTLIDIQGDRLLCPASNQKILTTAFALTKLGPEYTFETKVFRRGNDLVIQGDFDPLLGDPVLALENNGSIYEAVDFWASEVKKAMGDQPVGDILLKIAGNVRAKRNPDWPGNQNDRWYAAPVSQLNFHNNCFDVSFVVEGGKVTSSVMPASRFIEVDNRVTLGNRHVWSLKSVNGDESRMSLRGSVIRTTPDPISVAAECPELLLGRIFADRLVRAGVQYTGEIRLIEPEAIPQSDLVEVARTKNPVASAVNRANKSSLNMMADSLLFRAGDGTWTGSTDRMKEWLMAQYGLSGQDMVLSDGSGFSSKNRVTPQAVCKVLHGIAGQPEARVFLQSLAWAGIDGTLRKRFRGSACVGRVIAKTGYISGASCLSGYVLSKDHRPTIAFSILVNQVPSGKGYLAHELQEKLVTRLLQWLDAQQP